MQGEKQCIFCKEKRWALLIIYGKFVCLDCAKKRNLTFIDRSGINFHVTNCDKLKD